MARPIRPAVLLVLALLLASPAAGKRKPPPPPPPPPDTAADCTFAVVPSIDDYLVLATLSAGVQCETTKQSLTVTATFTRDGVDVPLIPYDTRTCTNTTACTIPSTSSRTTTTRSLSPATRSTARGERES